MPVKLQGIHLRSGLHHPERLSVGSMPHVRAPADKYSAHPLLLLPHRYSVTGYTLIHLVPRSASLQQAGGLHRMTLRGHTAPVPRVVISPNGADVITVSDDGTAQVGSAAAADDDACCSLLLKREGQTIMMAASVHAICVWPCTVLTAL